MSEERKRILKMLADGKISLDEADELLAAFQRFPGGGGNEAASAESPGADVKVKPKPRYLRVRILSGGKKEKVDLRVPLGLVNAGMKFGSLIPEAAREKVREAMHAKGIPLDLDRMKGGSMDDMAAVLSELDIDIEDGGDHVRVFCE